VLTGTLRWQLVVGMVLIQATMMSLFVWDHALRQRSAVLAQQSEHAVALSRSISTSAAVWVASRDFSGLQEIVDGLASYPDLQHAIVLDTKGQVLVHSDVSRRGLYLSDLPPRPVLEILGHDAALVDVANPVTLAGNHIGWVRIGLGQQSIGDRLAHTARDAVVYVLIAIVLAAVLATLAARRLTRRLYAIRSVADAVRAGRSELRADIAGADEAAQLQLRKMARGIEGTDRGRGGEIVQYRGPRALHRRTAESHERQGRVAGCERFDEPRGVVPASKTLAMLG
jgi:uncharacterized membrane protein affecting hemolysin expression